MQNNIGRKSMLRMLRQLRSKDGGWGGLGAVPCRAMPCRAGPRRAALGLALCSAQLPWIYDRIRQRQRQKHHDGLEPTSFRFLICHSTNCATLPLWIITFLTQPLLSCILYILYYPVYYTILYYAILYYTVLYYTILYYTILYYTILYYTILYYAILYYTIVPLTSACSTCQREKV